MNPREYQRMFELEDNYWWFVARRALALKLLKKFLQNAFPKVLDLGCGTGAMLDQLTSVGKAVGVDMSNFALDFARSRRQLQLVQGSGTSLPFVKESFDAVIGLDVFEHIEDHISAFAESFRVLNPGGILVISVPAFGALWGPHDIALHHFRRYRLSEVRVRLVQAGFEPIKLSYSVFFLFPAVVLVRGLDKLKRGKAKALLPNFPKWINQLLIQLQGMEANLLLKMSVPWGSSVVAVARKPLPSSAKDSSLP